MSKTFLSFSPFFIYQVSGNSMMPAYKADDRIIAQKVFFTLNLNDVVILRQPQTQRLLIKRITKIRTKTYFVTGDNLSMSTDSRNFGWIERKQIIGKVVWQLKTSK